MWRVLLVQVHSDFESARATAESLDDEDAKRVTLSLVYDKLGRHTEAAQALAKLQASTFGAAHPTLSAMTYAQWGDSGHALDYLDAAVRQHDSFLAFVKCWMLFDPLRKEPRFQAIERALNFPD
jgi:tetratricopeptide (TPR) repeat protein